MNDLGLTTKEFESLPDDLRKKFAALLADRHLDREKLFDRSSRRLNRRQLAYYKKMGLELPEESQDQEMRILGDNNTFNLGSSKESEGTGMNWLLAAGAAIAGAGLIGLVVWLAANWQPADTDTDTDSVLVPYESVEYNENE